MKSNIYSQKEFDNVVVENEKLKKMLGVAEETLMSISKAVRSIGYKYDEATEALKKIEKIRGGPQ